MGDGDVMSELGEAATRCPECGTTRPESVPATIWKASRRFVIRFAVLLAVIGFVVWQNVQAWPTLSPPVRFHPGGEAFPAHKYTRLTLEQYAAGEIADGQLVNDLYDINKMGNLILEAVFTSPEGGVSGELGYGWPAPFIVSLHRTIYDDAYAKTNPQPQRFSVSNGFRGINYEGQRTDARGRNQYFVFSPFALFAQLLALLIAWSLGKGARWVLIVSGVARRNGVRWRDRFAVRLPLCFGLAGGLCIAVLSFFPSVHHTKLLPKHRIVFSNALRAQPRITGLTNADLAGLRADPTGDAQAALAILNSLRSFPADPKAVLAIQWRNNGDVMNSAGTGGWPDRLLSRTIIRSIRPSTAPGQRRHVSTGRRAHFQRIVLRWGDPADRIVQYQFSLHFIGLIGFGMYVAWWLGGVLVWYLRRRSHRRAMSRFERGMCLACGYDLKGI